MQALVTCTKSSVDVPWVSDHDICQLCLFFVASEAYVDPKPVIKAAHILIIIIFLIIFYLGARGIEAFNKCI
jgi:hypothetical protein